MVETGASGAGDYRMRSLHLVAREVEEVEEVEEVMKHDFKAALEDFDHDMNFVLIARGLTEKKHLDAIRHALLLADKVTQNPSTAMLAAAQNAWLNDPTRRSSTVFKAMVEALMKEVEQ